jgi:hypothetical protein
MSRFSLIPALVAAAIAAGCDARDGRAPQPADGAPPPGRFTTDRTRYTAVRAGAGYTFTVVTRYENRGAAPVYLARCSSRDPHPVYGVRLLEPADSRGAAYDPAWGCVGHDSQFVVAPGAARVDTLHLVGPHAAEDLTGRPLGKLDGRFQLGFDARAARGDDAPRLPDSLQLSNPFEVRVAW